MALKSLKRNRGLGKDEVPAELLQAGASAMAVKVSEVYQRIVDTEQWVTAWVGGKLVDIFKNKGEQADADNSRGILLVDHIGKGLCELIGQHLNPTYVRQMPTEQFGAVPKRGTDIA
eukprot:2640021-Karenia_brevis.AAC.1